MWGGGIFKQEVWGCGLQSIPLLKTVLHVFMRVFQARVQVLCSHASSWIFWNWPLRNVSITAAATDLLEMSLACGSGLWGRLELEIPDWIRPRTMTADPQCMHLLTTPVKSLCPGWADHRLWKGSPFLEPGAALQGHTGILFTALPAVWRLSLARPRPASAQADSSLGNRALLSGPVAGGYWTCLSWFFLLGVT